MSDNELPQPPTRRRSAPAVEAQTELPDTTEATENRAKRGRKGRKATERRRRRKRGTNDTSFALKLGVGFEMDPNYEYRWINEGIDGQRLSDKHGDDWDTVTKEGAASDGVGGAVRRAVGANAAGPIYAYLCKKPKDWYENDQAERQKRNDKLMTAIKEGRDPTGSGKGLSASDNVHGDGASLTGRV